MRNYLLAELGAVKSTVQIECKNCFDARVTAIISPLFLINQNMFLNNDVTSERIQNLFDSALELIEQGIAKENTDIALAYLRIFCACQLNNFHLLSPNAGTLREQRDWGDEDLSETRYEDLNYEESLYALLERPLVEPEISTDT